MYWNAINFLYVPGHITLWCLELIPVVYASDVIPQTNMSELVCGQMCPVLLPNVFAVYYIHTGCKKDQFLQMSCLHGIFLKSTYLPSTQKLILEVFSSLKVINKRFIRMSSTRWEMSISKKSSCWKNSTNCLFNTEESSVSCARHAVSVLPSPSGDHTFEKHVWTSGLCFVATHAMW